MMSFEKYLKQKKRNEKEEIEKPSMWKEIFHE